ncbi:MAG: ABC transporter permease [Gemmatimonadetes bacterium]|nr:ABC transporter permease [Gemmatimonadota bacterium]MBP6668931.1 ABC transporter permease [Gemmatimonadales bacterium]MBK6778618.1 ABC transporter permease [Gemmatimonadota bacterium]MBK7349073.1 ABC transporter permease [Gemmatimonadota bacterium]MBK7714636.1 ABC transporter permease [Gemmatimonadota bacterium]
MEFTRFFEGIGIALDSLRANKVRAALTILGVAIGVMVVIAMASAITGINRSVAAQIETLGPKTFFVFRFFQAGLNVSDGSDEMSPWRRNPWLSVAEAEMLQKVPGIRSVSWQEGSGGPVAAGSNNLTGVNILGLSPDWILTQGGTIVAGRNFTQLEYAAGARVTVINDRLAQDLFPGLDPVGRRLKAYGEPFEVIGLYSEPKSLFGDSESPYIGIPHSTFTKVADYWKGWMQFAVIPEAELSVAEAQDRVTAALRSFRGLKPAQENNFSVVTQDKLLDSFNSITSGFFVVMLALSSVGLMVGGVGVVAIMMISVTERTREIGVRKALGATRREIMFQFLIEAATLTLVGGLAGMALGGLIALAIQKFTPIPAAVPLWSVVVAVLASTVTGIAFGLYPASKASRLDPVEALRYE